MRILLTGAGGQLGHALQEAFGDEELTALTRADCDIADPAQVRSAIEAVAPDVVLNAAAHTAVDACEDDDTAAWQVNAGGPAALARSCARLGAALVHFSTDYVFSGELDRPYTEFDRTDPRSVYGRSKEAGEQLVRQHLDAHYIVRTSWLQGRHGGNFVKTMLRLGRERDHLRVVDDQIGTPTFADDLARAVVELLATERYGTYHLAGSGACTWFELAQATMRHAGLTTQISPIDTATYGAPAPRPANSRLEGRNAALAGLAPLPAWEESLPALIKELSA